MLELSSLKNTIFDHLSLGIVFLEKGKILESNKAFDSLINYSDKSFTGSLFIDLLHEESKPVYKQALKENSSEFNIVVQLKSEVTKVLWVRLNYKHNSDYPLGLTLYSIENITKTQLKELAFSKFAIDVFQNDSQSIFSSVVQSLSSVFGAKYSCVGVLSRDGERMEVRAMSMDNELQERFSYSLKNTPCYDVVNNGYVIVRENVQNLYPLDEYLIDHEMESYIGIAMMDENNKVIGHIILMDTEPVEGVEFITSILKVYAIKLAVEVQKEIHEKELRVNEAKYRNLFELAYEAKMAYDPVKDHYVAVNKAACDLFGYSKDEMLTLNPTKLKPKMMGGIESSVFINMGIRMANNNERFIQESMNLKSDGSVFNSEVTVTMLDAEKGYLLISIRDISERKRVEKQLNEYQNELENLVQERTNEVDLLNSNLLKSNNSLEVSNKRLQLRKEELEKTLSELKITQDQLIQSEKMASLGVLISGLAHELNNPLNYIGGVTKPLRMDIEEIKQDVPETIKKKHLENFKEIETLLNGMSFGVEKITQIIHNLVTISPKSFQKGIKFFDLSAMIVSTCQLIGSTVQHVSFDLKIDPQIMVKGNDIEINQALLNIIKNATEAIPNHKNGVIKIKTKVYKKVVKIELTDNGVGMTEEVKNQIFQPFYSTKGPAKGTGLGLYISYGTIKKNQGDIKLISEEGKGTTFFINLPLA